MFSLRHDRGGRTCSTEGCEVVLPSGQARYCDPCRTFRKGNHHKPDMAARRKTAQAPDDYTTAQIDAMLARGDRERRRVVLSR